MGSWGWAPASSLGDKVLFQSIETCLLWRLIKDFSSWVKIIFQSWFNWRMPSCHFRASLLNQMDFAQLRAVKITSHARLLQLSWYFLGKAELPSKQYLILVLFGWRITKCNHYKWWELFWFGKWKSKLNFKQNKAVIYSFKWQGGRCTWLLARPHKEFDTFFWLVLKCFIYATPILYMAALLFVLLKFSLKQSVLRGIVKIK